MQYIAPDPETAIRTAIVDALHTHRRGIYRALESLVASGLDRQQIAEQLAAQSLGPATQAAALVVLDALLAGRHGT